MDKIIVTGGNTIHGEISISGAKNAVLPIIVGTLLAEDITVLHDVPKLSDVATIKEVLEILGAKVTIEDHTIFGGLGSLPGSFLGATVLTLLPELMRDLMQYRMFIYGALMVIMMIVKPDGLLGNLDFGLIREKVMEDKKVTDTEATPKGGQ